MPATNTSPVAHPYARISHPDQRKGGGLERQTKASLEEFCRRFGFTPGKRVWVDDGISAFKGLNATPEHQLGQFLADARRGVVRPGDCLLLENYDRLSRQDPWAAIGLVNDLRQLGIHVGRLDRMKLLRCDSTDYGDFFEAAIEFMRGNSESAAKSMRNGAAWEQKRKAARESGAVITHRLPAWIEERDGKFHLLAGPTAAVKRVFTLAAAGYGHQAIVSKLLEEGVPPFGSSGRWARSYVAKFLKDRRVVGEFQPRRRDRSPDGDPITDFFPAAVSEDEYHAARAGAAQRRLKRGRLGKHVNVFSGLLKSARDGESYFCTTSFGERSRGGRGSGNRVLKNTASLQGRAKCYTFPFLPFEAAILACLREIDPKEVLGGNGGVDEIAILAGGLSGVEAELSEAAVFMEANGFSPTIGKRITDLEARKRELAEKLSQARHKVAHPLSESWGEAKTLMTTLENAPDQMDARLRLRAVLRKAIDSIWMLVANRGADRLCFAQVWFHGGEKFRNYSILHRPPKANQYGKNTPGQVWAESIRYYAGPGTIDLRKREDAEWALEHLLHWNPEREEGGGFLLKGTILDDGTIKWDD